MKQMPIKDIAVEVYKLRLEHPSGGGPGAVARMITADKDQGEKLKGRAEAYEPTVRAVIEVLEKGGFIGTN